MNELITKIKLDIDVNYRLLKEDLPEYLIKFIKLWIKYDEELLKLVEKVSITEEI